MNTDDMSPKQREFHGVLVKHVGYWGLDAGSQHRINAMPTFPLMHRTIFFAPDMTIPFDDWNKKAMHHMNSSTHRLSGIARAARTPNHRAHGVVVSHPLRMRKALGSNPSVSIFTAVAMLCRHACVVRMLAMHANHCISRESNAGHIDGNDVFYH